MKQVSPNKAKWFNVTKPVSDRIGTRIHVF